MVQPAEHPYKDDKKSENSLEALTRDLAEQKILFTKKKAKSKAAKPASLEAIFRTTDPVLAALYKDLRNRIDEYASAVGEYGADSALIEVIADQIDSARSAYDTRVLELKTNHGYMAESMMLYRSAQEEYEDEKRAKKAKEREEAVREHWKKWYMMLRAAQQKRDRESIWGWILVLMLFMQANRHREHLYNVQKRI